MTDLANVDQATHQVLVAESRNSVLSLFPCSIFHNSKEGMLATKLGGRVPDMCDLPASLQIPMDNVPTRQPNSSVKKCHGRGGHREKKNTE